MTAEPIRRRRPRPLTAGWLANDGPYDYEYQPRLEHFFDGTSEWSYCGMRGLWATDRQAAGRRRCKWCVMRMITDGLLRVEPARRGVW